MIGKRSLPGARTRTNACKCGQNAYVHCYVNFGLIQKTHIYTSSLFHPELLLHESVHHHDRWRARVKDELSRFFPIDTVIDEFRFFFPGSFLIIVLNMIVEAVEDCHEFPCLCTHIGNRAMEAYDVGDMMQHIGANNVM